MVHLYETPGRDEPTDTVARAWRRGEGGAANGGGAYFRVMQRFGTRQRWWSHSIVDMLNAPKLFTLRWVILCFVNRTSEKNISRGSGLGTGAPRALWMDG